MITRESLHDQVVRHIALRILDEGLETLPNETDLGKELNVSRSILREAIKVLAAKGLVEVGPKGTRVRPRRDWNLFDHKLLEWIATFEDQSHFLTNLCELREAFEPKAAELAALRATPGEIAEIRAAWEEMQTSSNDRKAYNAADLRFHEAVFMACRNELFYQVAALTRTFLRVSFVVTSNVDSDFYASLPNHKGVLDAIARHDPVAARKLMHEVVGIASSQIEKFHQREERSKAVANQPKKGKSKNQNGPRSYSGRRSSASEPLSAEARG